MSLRRALVRPVAALVLATAACDQPVLGPESEATPPEAAAPPGEPSFAYGLDFGLLISPTGLDFGEVPIGTTSAPQHVTITNIASLPVTMSGAGGAPPSGRFGGSQNCQGLTLMPDQSCQMTFAFSPTAAGLLNDVSAGTWNGVEFNIALRGTGGGPRFLFTPNALDFGEVMVGSSSPPQHVVITNVGLAPVTMSGAGGAPPTGRFGGSQSCQGIVLAVGASCQMTFQFTPVAAGLLTDASVGNWNGVNFDIPLRGTGVGPVFRISPTSLDFGEVPVGTVAPQQTVNVTNLSPGPVVMSGAGGAPPTGRFGGSQNCQGTTLDPGETCQMVFAFQPNAAGLLTDVSTGNWNGQNFNVALRGVGLAAGQPVSQTFLITPLALDFGNVTIGTTAPTQNVTIRNVSSAPILMSGAGGAPPTGRFGGSQNCQGLTLDPGESCQMSFAFSPTAAGVLTDASIGSWNGESFNIALRGNGVHPSFRISPTGLDFGEVQVGTTSPTQTVQITNIGNAPVAMSGAGGAPPTGRFGGSQSCQGTTLDPGETCAMSFAFSPTAPGLLTDQSSGTWNGVDFDIDLRGTGVGPKFLITPFGLDFGQVPIGITGPTQTVSIINVGRAPVLMSGAGGAPPTQRFGGSQNCQGTTLAVGASCRMFFAFSPLVAGLLTDVSAGNWNGQGFEVALRGTGFHDALSLTMDLSPSTISLMGTGTTSAILLSSSAFDARTVALANVRMRVNGTTDVAPLTRNGVVISSLRDWNGDGLIDRMFSFRTSSLAEAGLTPGAGADALILRDDMSATRWTANDLAPPTFVP